MTDMTYKDVDTGYSERFGPVRGTLLLQLPERDGLPMLQVYAAPSRWHLLRRTRRGPIECASVWTDIDVGHGPFEVVEQRPFAEIEGELRRFFGDDPRVDVIVQWLPRP